MTRYVEDEINGKKSGATETFHPSFGNISVNRVQGDVDLFDVDYPQGHAISITISHASYIEENGRGRSYPRDQMMRIEMSEVQFAQMISNINTTGVPCTIVRYVDENGKYVRAGTPPVHGITAEKSKENMRDIGRKIGGNLDHIRDQVQSFADGKSPTKAQLRELVGWIEQTRQAIDSDLSFYLEQAQEKIDDTVTKGKIEFNAYVKNVLADVGRQSIADRLEDQSSLTKLISDAALLTDDRDDTE